MRSRRMIPVCTAMILAAADMSGCQIAGYDVTVQMDSLMSKDVFSVNGQWCSQREARLYLCNYLNLYGTAYGVDLWEYDFGDLSLEEYVRSVTLDELSRIYCMEQIAAEQGIRLDNADEHTVKAAAASYYDSLSKDEIDYMDVTQADIEEYYTRYALADKLYETMTEGEVEEVSDDDARVIRIRRILVSDAQKAQKAAGKLKSGSDFSTVAGSYNEADTLELVAARGQLPGAVEKIAFDMENGEVSGAIDTEEGTWFVECVNKFEKELSEANKVVIMEQRRKQQFDDAYASFKQKADCQLDEKAWGQITVENMRDIITTNSFFSVYESTKGK